MGGVFIVVEGFDGVGKTTLARRLAARLRREGLEVLEVREPGGTPLAEAARAVVLDPSLDATMEAELFLMLAARADLVRRVIQPALSRGSIVLSDRYELSTVAYQVAGRELPIDQVMTANRLATGGLTPDITLVLDAPIEVALERSAAKGSAPDRIESAGDGVRGRIASAFGAAEGEGIEHIDATVPAEEVESAAFEIVMKRLGGTRHPVAG